LVFFILHVYFSEKQLSLMSFIEALWERFKSDPTKGLIKNEIYDIVEKMAGPEVAEDFSWMVESTRDIPFEKTCEKIGLELKWQEASTLWHGINAENENGRLMVKSIVLDSPSYKAGVNAGDELIFLNQLRVSKEDVDQWPVRLLENESYQLIVASYFYQINHKANNQLSVYIQRVSHLMFYEVSQCLLKQVLS
jgi:predicted metalloprotease with PDZ domain